MQPHEVPVDIVVGFDTETHRFSIGNLAPKIVCLSAANFISPEDAKDITKARRVLFANADMPTLRAAAENVLDVVGTNVASVCHHAAYDLAVIASNFPDLIPKIFEALACGRIHCTKIREKLIHLTTHGDLKFMPAPGGQKRPIELSLSDLVMFYYNIDIKEGKSMEDAWRTNYSIFDGVPLEKWPEGAKDYAIEDAVYAVGIFHKQEEVRQQIIQDYGHDPFAVETFRVAADFCLYLWSGFGARVDGPEVLNVIEQVKAELTPEKLDLLYATGILRPAQPSRPYARGAQEHVEGCPKTWKDPNSGEIVKCSCPPKMTQPVEESLNDTVLKEFVRSLAEQNPDQYEIRYTPPSKKFPDGQLSTDAEFLEEHAPLNPVLEQLKHRQDLQKLVTTDIPRMMWEGQPAPRVHTRFDVLVRTGRTSSSANKGDGYPSMGCQNPHPGIRRCVIPDDGHLLFSIDFGSLELCTWAQKCLEVVGWSVMADKLNAGIDPHAYLGAQIALALDTNFNEFCGEQMATDAQAVYEIFLSLKGGEKGTPARDLFDFYRKMAKPTGLGYPGGLGPATFVKYAKGTFGVVVDIETATRLRDIWKTTFPEAEHYFNWINTQCEDTRNGPVIVTDRKTGQEKKKNLYKYESPMGMVRMGCDYCAASNGAGMQTPAAEGGLMAVFNVTRAVYDYTMNSPLCYDSQGWVLHPMFWIHDEIVGSIRNQGVDKRVRHERIMEVCRIMQESMQAITPGVKIKTSACLMERWDKNAEPVYDSEGLLDVWQPKVKTA